MRSRRLHGSLSESARDQHSLSPREVSLDSARLARLLAYCK